MVAPVLAAEAFGAMFDDRCDKRDAGKYKVTAIANLELRAEEDFLLCLSVEEANGRLKVWMGTKGEREEGSGATSS